MKIQTTNIQRLINWLEMQEDEHGFDHKSGSVEGLYYNAINRNGSDQEENPFKCHVFGGGEYSWNKLATFFLGVEGITFEDFEAWTKRNPHLWGNDQASFVEGEHFTFFHDQGYEATVGEVIKHLEGVLRRNREPDYKQAKTDLTHREAQEAVWDCGTGEDDTLSVTATMSFPNMASGYQMVQNLLEHLIHGGGCFEGAVQAVETYECDETDGVNHITVAIDASKEQAQHFFHKMNEAFEKREIDTNNKSVRMLRVTASNGETE